MNWPPEPCILEGVPAADYHADLFGDVATLSRSVAHTGITTSWLHAAAEHPRLPGLKAKRATKEMDLGSLVHALLLGGEEGVVIVEADNFRTRAAQDARDAAQERGLTPICRPLYEEVSKITRRLQIEICGAINEVRMCHEIPTTDAWQPAKWSDVGWELTVLWEEPGEWCPVCGGSGFSTPGSGYGNVCGHCGGQKYGGPPTRCRARLDIFLAQYGIIADVKVVSSGYANARKFIRQLNSEDDSGAMQAASYCRGVEAALPHLAGRTKFVFLRVEVQPPYAVVPILVPEGMRSLGEARWLRGVAGWAKCLASGTWPGPGPAVAHVESWAFEREMERQASQQIDSEEGGDDELGG